MHNKLMIVIFSCCLGLGFTSQASEIYLPFEGEEITVETYPNEDSNWRFIWLHSQYDELARDERQVLKNLHQAGLELWASDILNSLFLTRSSTSIRSLDGRAIATILQAAEEASKKDGKGIIILASDRMAGLALKGVHQWQAQHLGQQTNFKGSVLLFPNLYASRPLAGEEPNWESVVSVNQAPVMILQPEQGVHRWYAAMLSEELAQQGSAVYSWVLPGVKDYFISPFEEKSTKMEQQITSKLPGIISLSAERLSEHAALQHPKELAQIAAENTVADEPKESLPKLHSYADPKQAPGLRGVTFDGDHLDLADLDGKVILVNFWASWCPPCVTEIPSMNRLLAKYQEQGLEIFSVDFQESADEIAKFVARVPVDYPVVLDEDGRISKEWGVFSFPTTFVVDRQGKVRYSLNQGVEWDIPELEAPLLELLNQR